MRDYEKENIAAVIHRIQPQEIYNVREYDMLNMHTAMCFKDKKYHYIKFDDFKELEGITFEGHQVYVKKSLEEKLYN